MRKSEIERTTGETSVRVSLNIDGCGESEISTGVGFLDHMLTLFARHGRFDLNVYCEGDTYVDDHHSVEDVGIVLGTAFREALGDMGGINRYGNIILPMDEALVLAAVDISGRSFLSYDVCVQAQKIGTFDTELAEEFFAAFVRNAQVTLHVRKLSGTNSHHIIEGAFKAFGRVMREAAAVDESLGGAVPSTKGVL